MNLVKCFQHWPRRENVPITGSFELDLDSTRAGKKWKGTSMRRGGPIIGSLRVDLNSCVKNIVRKKWKVTSMRRGAERRVLNLLKSQVLKSRPQLVRGNENFEHRPRWEEAQRGKCWSRLGCRLPLPPPCPGPQAPPQHSCQSGTSASRGLLEVSQRSPRGLT